MCECGHPYDLHDGYEYVEGLAVARNGNCRICGCPDYSKRHHQQYDPDDVRDQGYNDEGYPYSGLGKVRRW